MAFSLSYNGLDYQVSEADGERLQDSYDSGKPFGPQRFAFTPLGRDGTVVIVIGTGIPLTLDTNDD
jgi:hypothetical protein